jgi:SPP1 gp7 family putative phage head morphogenesis protein
MPSQVISVMRGFKRDLLAGERAQMQEMARRWLMVERRLLGNINATAEAMARLKKEGRIISRELVMQDRYYRDLLGQLASELDAYTAYTNDTIMAQQQRMVRLALRHSAESIQVQGVTAGFNRLPVEAVENMVGLASNGSPLRYLLNATWPDAVEGLTQALITGIATGQNPRMVAREMARGAASSLNRMMTIARTEQLRAYREANQQSYIASGVVTEYKRLATHDSRVCAACLMDEGSVYPLYADLAIHPNCRCTLVPVVEGVASPTWVAGADWFEEQEAETQKSILGPGRYYAWQNGDFNLDQLVTVKQDPTWGPTLQVTPLKELV